MVDYIEKLRADLVEQFKDKPVIDALNEAIGTQLVDLYQFLLDLKEKRGLHTAEGKQLDGVGDIAVLSREEAGELACVKESVFVLDDDGYRNFLIYKIWKNTNRCTYYDIIRSFRMFWDKPLHYSEDPEVPATMLFETDDLSPDDDVARLLTAPFIKAAGVAIRVVARTVSPEMISTLPVTGYMGRGYMLTTLPEIDLGLELNCTMNVAPAMASIMQTTLPEMEVRE